MINVPFFPVTTWQPCL